jgi:copper transport protein
MCHEVRCRLLSLWLAAAAAAVALALIPVGAEAHASLTSSTPQPCLRLPGGPGAVILNFSEPINRDLSQARVTSPDGRSFGRTAVSSHSMTVRVTSDAPGVYAVRWTTVSAVDGHVLTGSFRFGVRVSVSPAPAEASSAASSELALPTALFRGLEDAALLTAAGLILLGLLGQRAPRLTWARPGHRLTAAMAVGLVGAAATTTAETWQATHALSPDAFGSYFGNGVPGMARALRIAAEAAALGLSPAGARWVAPALAAALVGVAGAGHAAATQPAAAAIAVDAVHLTAAGAWAGGILALSTLRPPGGWLREQGRTLINRFSRPAAAAFLVTAVTGVVRGEQELASPLDLVASTYGRVLTAKVLAVGVMAVLSLLASRRMILAPRLEGAAALMVVGAAALLTAFPLPPAGLQEANAFRQASAALPQEGDLTVGLNAGDVVLGLTLRPAQPGPNQIWMTVLPVEGTLAAGRLPVLLAVEDRSVTLRLCGPGCRTATADLRGGEALDVKVEGSGGGTARFVLPRLPAVDARDQVRRLEARMSGLRALRVYETLRPAPVPLVAKYAFEAPDRMSLDLSSGGESIIVGPVRYSRDGPAAQWKMEDALPVRAPAFPWDSGPVVAPTLLGVGEADGVPVQVVSVFNGTAETPVWMRVWVDGDSLVRRVEMRARAHIMDDRNYDFDAPIVIAAPGSG